MWCLENIICANWPVFRNLSESGASLAKLWYTQLFTQEDRIVIFPPFNFVKSDFTLLGWHSRWRKTEQPFWSKRQINIKGLMWSSVWFDVGCGIHLGVKVPWFSPYFATHLLYDLKEPLCLYVLLFCPITSFVSLGKAQICFQGVCHMGPQFLQGSHRIVTAHCTDRCCRKNLTEAWSSLSSK